MADYGPRYWELLREALEAGEAVDAFDVHDEDEDSRNEFDRLLKESDEAQQALISYITEEIDAWSADFAKED